MAEQINVQIYLTEFSNTFAELFLESVDYARDIVIGRAEKCDKLVTTVGAGIGYVLGLPVMAGELGKSLGTGIAKYTVQKKELKRMKVILSAIPNGVLEIDTFQKQVVEGAVKFFVAYELQLRQLIRQNSTNRLLIALDASARIFDYIYNQMIRSNDFVWDIYTISKGIIFGKSNRDLQLSQLFKMRTRPGQMLDNKYSSVDLFLKPGTVNGNKCVVPVKSKYSEFGYRLCLPFEVENNSVAGRTWTLGRLPIFTDWKNPELTVLTGRVVNKVLETLNDKMEESLDKLTQNCANIEVKLNYHSEKLDKILDKLNLNGDTGPRTSKVTRSPIWFEVPEPVVSFTGRDSDLEKLHTLVTDPRKMTVISQITSITGLGGIGKTQLAAKYAHDFSQHFNGNVIWINSETLQSTRDSFLRLVKVLNIKTDESGVAGAELNAEVMKRLYEELSSIKVLLIFDNAEAHTSDQHNFGIREYLPQNFSLPPSVRRPFILITSRNTRWGQGVSVMELGVLKEEDALKLILDTLGPQSDEENARKLCKVLGRLPLALQQAIAYIQNLNETPIKSYTCPIAKYLELFNENMGTVFHDDLNDTGQNTDMYETSVSITWNITLDKIKKEMYGAKAIELMELIADYWNPDYIDLKYFTVLMSTQEVNQSVLLLKKYSMVKGMGGILNVHRLVQHVIRSNMDEARRRRAELEINLVHYNERYHHYINTFGPENFFASIYHCYCARMLNQLMRYQEARSLCLQYRNIENQYLHVHYGMELGMACIGLHNFQEAEETLAAAVLLCAETKNWSLIILGIGYIEILFETQNRVNDLSCFWKSLVNREAELNSFKAYFKMRPE